MANKSYEEIRLHMRDIDQHSKKRSEFTEKDF